MEAKLAALAELDLDSLAVVNPGCQRQMIAAMRRAGLRARVLHLAELVALAQSAVVQSAAAQSAVAQPGMARAESADR